MWAPEQEQSDQAAGRSVLKWNLTGWLWRTGTSANVQNVPPAVPQMEKRASLASKLKFSLTVTGSSAPANGSFKRTFAGDGDQNSDGSSDGLFRPEDAVIALSGPDVTKLVIIEPFLTCTYWIWLIRWRCPFWVWVQPVRPTSTQTDEIAVAFEDLWHFICLAAPRLGIPARLFRPFCGWKSRGGQPGRSAPTTVLLNKARLTVVAGEWCVFQAFCEASADSEKRRTSEKRNLISCRVYC